MSLSSALADAVSFLSADPFRQHSADRLPVSVEALRTMSGFDGKSDAAWEAALGSSRFRVSLVFPGFLYRENSAGVVEFASVEAAAAALRSSAH